MEIQKHLQQAVSQVEPAQTGLQVYKASDDAFQVARISPQLATADNTELVEVLQHCMLMVGIRANNMPVQLEFDVLKAFIRRNFPSHSVKEILLAFNLACAGKLELGPEGAKCFENFSCEYVGRILSAYTKWAAPVAKEIDRKETAQLQRVLTAQEKLDIEVGYLAYLVSESKKKIKKRLKPPLKWNLRPNRKK